MPSVYQIPGINIHKRWDHKPAKKHHGLEGLGMLSLHVYGSNLPALQA